MINITRFDNKILKHIAKLDLKSYRDKAGEFIVEGERICGEAISACSERISCVLLTNEFLEKNIIFQKKLDDLHAKIYTVSETIFKRIAKTQTPQGVLCVLKKPSINKLDFAKLSNVLILDGVSEPGNMGTIVRTANAFGFGTVILNKGCVDVYNPKVVRTTMGAIFKVNFVETDNIAECIAQLKAAKFSVVSTALKNSTDINKVEISEKTALVIGSEARGVSEEILKLSDMCVKIPMSEGAESLNAAVAAGIVMHLAMCKSRLNLTKMERRRTGGTPVDIFVKNEIALIQGFAWQSFK